MKQLHKQSSNTRKDEEMPFSQTPPYSPKSMKHPRSLPRSLNYILREQRLLFILIGVLIGSTFFVIQPSLSALSSADRRSPGISSGGRHSLAKAKFLDRELSADSRSSFVDGSYNRYSNGVGRVPVGIGSKRRRIVVTGGAGFVGSHLVDKLIARGDDVIVIDNFFTGRKENVVHLFGNPRFELIRHDVVEPILLEVDQIYHLACPASPVHYKYNPVKTIISFF
ncbi:UDP-glucuronic acid decarboxylase 1 [Striga hermonthica]|uniref:UDP-glucuronate decarboxylase n=1 Tax=Striga hermonthica TaxID=68872 RepID=A0A9N7P285_STRHE|nr:UDP-glucuronic acid decarboxylase 1 [Striga hermonthica]